MVCTAEAALKKLKKSQVGVYNCKKAGAEFAFCVKDKDLKKVFAIFSNPCYNIRVENLGRRAGFLKSVVNRIGLVVGAFVYIQNKSQRQRKLSHAGSKADNLRSGCKRIQYVREV